MVQLKASVTSVFAYTTILFQFHDGTIKSCKVLASPYVDCWFQFHDGTIKRPRQTQRM